MTVRRRRKAEPENGGGEKVTRREVLTAVNALNDKLDQYIDAHEKWSKTVTDANGERISRLEREVHELRGEIQEQSRSWKIVAAISIAIGLIVGGALDFVVQTVMRGGR